MTENRGKHAKQRNATAGWMKMEEESALDLSILPKSAPRTLRLGTWGTIHTQRPAVELGVSKVQPASVRIRRLCLIHRGRGALADVRNAAGKLARKTK